MTVETAGTVLPELLGTDPIADLMSISPKLASSGPPADTPGGWAARHANARRRDDVLEALMRIQDKILGQKLAKQAGAADFMLATENDKPDKDS